MAKRQALESKVIQLFDNQIYWKIEDVEKFTGLKKKTIYNLCSLGKIPFLKQRKKLAFIPEEIRAWDTPKGGRN